MLTLQLDEKEREILKGALETFQEELKDEIGKTDRREWRAALHDEETVIRKILQKVSLQ